MKTIRNLAACLLLSAAISACSKNDTENDGTTPVDEGPDRTNCLWTSVDFFRMPGMPFYIDSRTFEYDTEKRLTWRKGGGSFSQYSYEPGKIKIVGYINAISPGNIVSNTEMIIRASDSRIIEKNVAYVGGGAPSRFVYEYDAAGYLVNVKEYFSSNLQKEYKYTYTNGNLTYREDVSYTQNITDKLYYTYDNTTYYPESYLLAEMVDPVSGVPNKNNVTEIRLERAPSYGYGDVYKTIKYSYVVKGKRLAEVKMTATTAQNNNIEGVIGFGYTCP